ncbi:MAG: AAA family ATPase, partial [Cyanobacteria bacterium SZAS TMP-1]|nr:AAA family ATPase [Cyanobacteria bacterium SZAS TMP-1]
MECFRKAAELRELANKFQANIVSKATKEKERLLAAQPKALPAPKAAPIVYKSPAEILAVLDGVAIGQHAAKRGLANAASQHIRRMQLSPEDRAKTDKSNVLLVGPTGCGKTLLAEALAGAINVPFYRTEATKLTAAGYVGEDVQSLL